MAIEITNTYLKEVYSGVLKIIEEAASNNLLEYLPKIISDAEKYITNKDKKSAQINICALDCLYETIAQYSDMIFALETLSKKESSVDEKLDEFKEQISQLSDYYAEMFGENNLAALLQFVAEEREKFEERVIKKRKELEAKLE